MNNIGAEFKEARLATSLSLEEASADTLIPVAMLEQIEDGSIGGFKDIFKLREYLKTYAKYLGLDPDKIIDDFNEYMFEYTSKIPVADLEKAIEEKEEEEIVKTTELQAVSPYLMPKQENGKKKMVITIIVIIILIAITLVWAIKQVM